MNFIRKSLWALLAILALSYQPVQAMEKEEEKKNYFSYLPAEMEHRILRETLMVDRLQNKSFFEVCKNLSLVCKDWNASIKENAKKWVCDYFNIEKQHKDDFWRFFNGKLIYKPDPNGDKGRVDLFFSAVPNPFNETLDLSKCGDYAGKYLSFHLGIPTENKESAEKVQTWIFFSPHVANQLETTARHLKPVFPVKVPVGILWTWGKSDDLGWYDYLVTENNDNLSKINMYANWEKSEGAVGMAWCVASVLRGGGCYARFQVLFVN